MELLVAVLVILGFVAIAIRFGLRGPSGPARLPRIVDDSIGMWLLRRVTGRPLVGRTAGDRPDPFARFRRPSTVLAVRAQPRSAAAPSPTASARPGRADPGARITARAGPSPSRSHAGTRSTEPGSATATTVAAGGPVRAAARPRMARLLGYAGLAAMVGVAGFVVGALLGLVAGTGSAPAGSRAGGAGGEPTAAPSVRASAPTVPGQTSTTH